MDWIGWMVLGALMLAGSRDSDGYWESLENYRRLFPQWNRDQALNDYRVTTGTLGLALIAVAIVRLGMRLWGSAHSLFQRTSVVLWSLSLCLLGLWLYRTVDAFRTANPSWGARLTLNSGTSIATESELEREQPGVAEVLWERQTDIAAERARRRMDSLLTALVVLLFGGIVAGAVLEVRALGGVP